MRRKFLGPTQRPTYNKGPCCSQVALFERQKQSGSDPSGGVPAQRTHLLPGGLADSAGAPASAALQGLLGCRMEPPPPLVNKGGGASSNPLEGNPGHLAPQTPPTHSAAGRWGPGSLRACAPRSLGLCSAPLPDPTPLVGPFLTAQSLPPPSKVNNLPHSTFPNTSGLALLPRGTFHSWGDSPGRWAPGAQGSVRPCAPLG